jgi:hypothetical protein
LRAKRFGDSRDQRSFRTNDGHFGSDRLSEACKSDRVIHIGWQARCDFADTCVARRAVKVRCVRAAGEFPCERVFPATAADDKNFHSDRVPRWDISNEIVPVKSSERKPSVTLNNEETPIIQPFWFVTLHLRRARLILQMADEVFARFGLKTPMSFAHRVGPDRG